MEKTIKERVKQALNVLNISPSAVANFRGLRDRTVLDQINGDSKIGVATVEALLAYRPEVSAEWIMRGTGGMTFETSETSDKEAELRDIIRRQQREIDGLYERIAEIKEGMRTRKKKEK